jgi:hypothetical protein
MRIQSRPIAVDLTTAAAILLLGACQSASPPPPPRPAPTANFLSAPTSPDAIVDSDPAAVRLQDIGGYVLLYYREHQAMPPTLDELRNIPGGGDLDFNSPSSRQPFAYSQAGMWAPDKGDKCIIAYDPSSSPSGKRWCLFMMLPKGGAALSVDVVALPEPIFLSYRPVEQ